MMAAAHKTAALAGIEIAAQPSPPCAARVVRYRCIQPLSIARSTRVSTHACAEWPRKCRLVRALSVAESGKSECQELPRADSDPRQRSGASSAAFRSGGKRRGFESFSAGLGPSVASVRTRGRISAKCLWSLWATRRTCNTRRSSSRLPASVRRRASADAHRI